MGAIGAYYVLTHIYGDKNPRKWKSVLFSKNDTLKNVFSPYIGKRKESDEKLKETSSKDSNLNNL